jgi:hypothetical protein
MNKQLENSIMYNARDLTILSNTNDKGRELVKKVAELSGLTEHDVLCYIALYEGAGIDWTKKPIEKLVEFVTL